MNKRVLCLGNNTEDTDVKTRALAATADTVCHGLLSSLEQALTPTCYQKPGYYHSSVYDLEFGQLIDLMTEFDRVIVLDQPITEWSHPDAFYKTLQAVSKTSTVVEFLDPSYKQTFDYFSQLVKDNKSFCIFPFIELLINYGHTTVCCRSSTPITKFDDLIDFQNDKNYVDIRNKMIQGELLPEHCSACYKLENLGITSARQQETVEWAQRLNIKNISDLKRLTKPVYYEVRSSNKCNLLCRTCAPESSHLIEREYKKLGIVPHSPTQRYTNGFEIVDFESVKKIYIAGGEPTVMHEFYKFLDDCIEQNRTDIEILVNTNGTNISNRLKDLLPKFRDFQFVFSIDGFDGVNDYIRWPSRWTEIIDNWRYLITQGHKVCINTTVSIYNVSTLHLLYDFIDAEFPNTLVHCSLVDFPAEMSPLDFPDPDLALTSLHAVTKTRCYANDPLFADSINGLIYYFQNNHVSADLSKFFKINDKLDQSRSVRLKDYIPSLDKYRDTSYNNTL